MTAPIIKLEWEDPGQAVLRVGEGEGETLAQLNWEEDHWLLAIFPPPDQYHNITLGEYVLPAVDDAEVNHLRAIANENAAKAHEQPEAVRAALAAALVKRQNETRDDTKELAEWMAVARARKAWQTFWQGGCTGWINHRSEIEHDGETCPVHEL